MNNTRQLGIHYFRKDNRTVLVTHKSSGSTINCTREHADKMAELLNLFGDVDIEVIKNILSSDAGKLAHSVLLNQGDTTPVRELIDELMNNYLSVDSGKQFFTRQALINELEDVLRAKSITPYRRSRINKAFKRACIKCHGSGKEVIVKHSGISTHFGQKHVRHEIDSRSPDCTHCGGTGIEPKKEGKIFTITREDLIKANTVNEPLSPNPLDEERNDGNDVG